mgnify:CR=1 FL=1
MKITKKQIKHLIREGIFDMFVPGAGRARDMSALRQSLEAANQSHEELVRSREDKSRSQETDNEMILDLIMELLIEHGKIKSPSRSAAISYLEYLTRKFK